MDEFTGKNSAYAHMARGTHLITTTAYCRFVMFAFHDQFDCFRPHSGHVNASQKPQPCHLQARSSLLRCLHLRKEAYLMSAHSQKFTRYYNNQHLLTYRKTRSNVIFLCLYCGLNVKTTLLTSIVSLGKFEPASSVASPESMDASAPSWTETNFLTSGSAMI